MSATQQKTLTINSPHVLWLLGAIAAFCIVMYVPRKDELDHISFDIPPIKIVSYGSLTVGGKLEKSVMHVEGCTLERAKAAFEKVGFKMYSETFNNDYRHCFDIDTEPPFHSLTINGRRVTIIPNPKSKVSSETIKQLALELM